MLRCMSPVLGTKCECSFVLSTGPMYDALTSMTRRLTILANSVSCLAIPVHGHRMQFDQLKLREYVPAYRCGPLTG